MAAVERPPMRVYQLLWQLIVHVLHGGWRDEVNACVSWSDGQDGHVFGGIAGGPAVDFSWPGGEDRFVIIDAHCDARPDPSLLHL